MRPEEAKVIRDERTTQMESSRVVKSLRTIANWVEDINQPLDAQAEAALNSILQTYAKKSQVTAVALAHYHLKKVVDWLEQADQVEKLLKKKMDEFGEQMPPEELRRTIELHHKRIKDAMEYIDRLVEKIPNIPKQVADDDERRVKLQQGSTPVLETVEKREKARRLLDLISSLSDESDAEVIEGELVESDADLLNSLKQVLDEK